MDKRKSLKPLSIIKMEGIKLNNTKCDNNKIIEFRKYADRCRKIDDSLKLELEAEIITIDEVREKKEAMKKNLEKLVLEIHKYSIKQMVGKDTRWVTTVKEEGADRKIIKKNTYEELIEFLIEYYDVKGKSKKYTLRTMYPIWRDYKQSATTKMSYIRRIEADWKAFYLNDKIIDIPLNEMTTNQISQWLNHKITVDGITNKKKFYNMITIFKNIFAYCYEEKLVDENTFSRARYRNDLLSDYVKPNASTQVFTEEERDKIVELAYQSFAEHSDQTTYLAVALLFQCGVRCGELVALETSDYDPIEKTLSVTKSECRNFTVLADGTLKYSGTIIGAPKKAASNRLIKLNDEACYIVETIIKANEANGVKDNPYLFVYRNKRIQTASVLKRIYKLCDALGIDRRSTHKIRKTVLTELVNTCVSEDVSDISSIREFAGHVDESTLMRNYVFATKKEEIHKLTRKALQSKTWNDRVFPNVETRKEA